MSENGDFSKDSMDSQVLPSPDMPMKWHKFLIYFLLWVSAVTFAFQAYQYLTGNVHQGNRALVYSYYSGMQAADIMLGLVFAGLAGYAVATRMALANYKAAGPGHLIRMYVINLAAQLLYVLFVSAVTHISFSTLLYNSWGSVFGAVLGIFLHRIYYAKRAHLFVN